MATFFLKLIAFVIGSNWQNNCNWKNLITCQRKWTLVVMQEQIEKKILKPKQYFENVQLY